MAKPDSKQTRGKGRVGRQPIIRHPLFPGIVALWFAALLGVGSLALRTPLLEALVLASGIDAVVPAAGPPLGIAARLLLAFVLGLVGGVMGFVLACRLAEKKDVAAPDVFKVADADLDAAMITPAPKQAAACPEPAIEAPDGPLLVQRSSEAPEPEVAFETAPELVRAPPASAAERIACADLAELSHVELIERLAIALQRRQERRGATATDNGATGRGAAAGPVVPFPDFADRRMARRTAPAPVARLAPQQTEQALRDALNALQRMSGGI